MFVHFHFISGDLEQGGHPVALIRVHFLSLTSEFAVPEFTASADQSVGYYSADIDEDFQMNGSIPFPQTTELPTKSPSQSLSGHGSSTLLPSKGAQVKVWPRSC
jgi:hypothetical protein